MSRRTESVYRDDERLLTEEEAAAWLNIKVTALQKMRYRIESKGPPFTKVGGKVRYSTTALRQYLESNTRDPSERLVLEIERKLKRSA